MSSRICCSATDPMFVPVVSTTRSTLMVVGRCAWATPNPVTSTSLNHPRLLVVQGTTAMFGKQQTRKLLHGASTPL